MTFLVALVFCIPCTQVAANPSSANPTAGIEVRDDPTSTQLAAEATQLATAAERELSEWESQLEAGRPTRANTRDLPKIGEIAVIVQQLKRIAERLIILHEPAGHDYLARSLAMDARVSHITATYRKLPDFGKVVPLASRQLGAISKRKQALLPRVGSWFKQGKLDLAETGIYDTIDELTQYAVWPDRTSVARAMAPFNAAKKTVDDAIRKQREDQAAQMLVELRTLNDPKFDVAKARLDDAIKSVAEEGNADWEGESLTGPKLVLAWGQLWRDLQQKTMAARAIEYAHGERANSRPPSQIDKLHTGFEDFSGHLAESIGELIKADAGQAKPETGYSLYVEYVAAVGELAAHTADDRVEKAVQPALAELAATVPALPLQVEGYRRATTEVLKWRKRAALALERAHIAKAEQSPAIAVANVAAAQVDRSAPGLGAKRANSGWQIVAPAPLVVKQIAEKSIGKQVHVGRLSPQPETNPSVSQYEERFFAELARARISPKKIEQLKKDLLVSANSPPLTIKAARAIRSAELGFAEAAGGEVVGITIRGFLPGFLSKSDFVVGIPLGSLPGEVELMNPDDQAMLSYEIRPSWLRHEFIFQELP